MDILLEGRQITNKSDLFTTLKKQINDENFFGHNLDALWDTLLEVGVEINIVVKDKEMLENNLGDYAIRVFKLFKDLTEINQKATFIFK